MAGKQEKPTGDEKQKRLQQALRANLHRRKQQDHIPPAGKKGA